MIETILNLKSLNNNLKQKLIEYSISNYQYKWYEYNLDSNIKISLKILHKSYNILLN